MVNRWRREQPDVGMGIRVAVRVGKRRASARREVRRLLARLGRLETRG